MNAIHSVLYETNAPLRSPLRVFKTALSVIKEMKNNISLWIHLHKDDIFAFFKLFIPILLLIFIVREIPSFTRNYFLSKLDSEKIGIIDNIEKVKGIHESEVGSKIIIKSYRVNYHYVIEDKRIDGNEIIDMASITLKQKIRLNKIEKGDSILIKYDSGNLEHCKIKIR